MNHKKLTLIFNIIGLVLGLVVVIVGVFLPQNYDFNFDGAYTFGSDGTTFGSDFYTYEYNATRTISKNTASAALAMEDINENINQYASFTFVLAGLLIMLTYVKKIFATTPLKTTPIENTPLPSEYECGFDANISQP